MKVAYDWLADDGRAQRVLWLLVALNVAGGIVSVASYRQHRQINDAVVVVNVGLVVAVMVVRALAVKALWLAALGVSPEVVAVVLHWHPIGVFALLAPFLGFAVLIVLVFYLHPPIARDDNSAATVTVNGTSLSDEAAVAPDSAKAHRSLPGDPDFTSPSPPR